MPDTIEMGPLLIRTSLLLYALAALPAGWLMRTLLLHNGIAPRPVLDTIVNALIAGLLVWKFGGLLFEPSLLWRNPAAILATGGTWKETALAGAVSLMYAWRAARKRNLSMKMLFDLIPYGYLVLAAVQYFFLPEYGTPTRLPWGMTVADPEYRYHPVHAYGFLLSAVLLGMLWRVRRQTGTLRPAAFFLTGYGAGIWLLSFFRTGASLWGILRPDQLLAMGMIAAGLHILLRERR